MRIWSICFSNTLPRSKMRELPLPDGRCERRIGYGEGLLVAAGGYGDAARGRGRDVPTGFLNYAHG